MFHRIVLTAIIAMVTVCQASVLAQRPRNDTLTLRMTPIMDPHGWAQPVVAKALLVPDGWRTKGAVRWRLADFTGCPYHLTEERFEAASADGRLRFEMLPDYVWQWSENRIAQASIQLTGCKLARPLDVGGVLRQYVIPSFRQGAAIRETRASKASAKAALQEIQSLWGDVLKANGTKVATESLIADLAYEENGRAYEEQVMLTLSKVTTPVVGGGVQTSYRAYNICAFRAPKGEWKQHGKLFSAMLASLRVNPAWRQAVIQVFVSINLKIALGAGRRARIWDDAVKEIGEKRMAVWKRGQQSRSRVARSFSQALRGVDVYLDPRSELSFDLPTGYHAAWSNGNNEFILSKDPAFNPNTARMQRSWYRLKRREN